MPAEELVLEPLPLGEADVEISLLDVTRLVDAESVARRFLTPRERAEYARLRHPSRRREWLGARVCLKEMLRRRRRVGDPLQCEIVKDARGRPGLSFLRSERGHAVYDCSLSHTGRFACAGVSSRPGVNLGVDVEQISGRLLGLRGAFVRDGDALVGGRPPEEELAILWALKEACAKAVGGGIGFALADVISEETAEGRHRVRSGTGLEFRARHVLIEGYVIALCLGTEYAGATHDR